MRPNRRNLLLAAAALSAILSFGAGARAQAQTPIKIGLTGPFTGGSSSMGV